MCKGNYCRGPGSMSISAIKKVSGYWFKTAQIMGMNYGVNDSIFSVMLNMDLLWTIVKVLIRWEW